MSDNEPTGPSDESQARDAQVRAEDAARCKAEHDRNECGPCCDFCVESHSEKSANDPPPNLSHHECGPGCSICEGELKEKIKPAVTKEEAKAIAMEDFRQRAYTTIATEVSGIQITVFTAMMARNPMMNPNDAYLKSFDAATTYYDAAFNHKDMQIKQLNKLTDKTVAAMTGE